MADALSEAQTLYRKSLQALEDQRAQIEEDLEFSDPADPKQWTDRELRQRERDPGGSRPCLVLDQLGQYIANVAGQVENSPPALHAIPVDGGADKKVAEQLDGHFRHIEHASRAANHYQRAYTSSARCGVGYLLARPTMVNAGLRYMEPRIDSEGDPLRVVFDPWSVALDGDDATFGYLLTPMSMREFKRQFPGKDPVSFGAEDRKLLRDDRESVLTAEAWTMEDKKTNHIVFLNQRQDEVCLTEDDFWQAHQRGEVLQVLRNYMETTRSVWWRRMSGADVLETSTGPDGKEAPFPADRIGIVPMYGYVSFLNGRMKYCGIARRAREGQRNYNYHASEIRAYMGTAPKAPWIVPVRAIRGFEQLWDKASTEQRAYLPYNDLDETGAIQMPQRPSIAVNLQNHMAGLEQAKQDIQAAIGMYQANLGAPSNETSGVAIEQRKQQGEASVAHFQSHGSASIAQVGKLCMQMVCKLMDTKRRMRVLGFDGSSSAVTLDPKQSSPAVQTEDGLSINPNIGTYDVRVVVGAAYSTQRQQAQEAFSQMMQSNPALGVAIAPLWAQVLDVPHADKLAQVLTAMAPPQVQAILKPEGEDDGAPDAGALAGQLQQMQQALQEAIQHARDAQAEADQAHQAIEQMQADQEAKERELEIKQYDAETKRLQVTGANEAQVQAIVQNLMVEMGVQSPAEGEPQTYEMQQFPAGAPEQPEEPAEPDPHEEEERQRSEQQAARLDAVLQGQSVVAEKLDRVASLLAKPRVRLPIRDGNGDLQKVVEMIDDREDE